MTLPIHLPTTATKAEPRRSVSVNERDKKQKKGENGKD
jgi:hypothetical protein